MAFWKRGPEAGTNMEAGAEAKPAMVRREKPDFSALAHQRQGKLVEKSGGLWEKMKALGREIRKGAGVAKDFVLTLDARTAYRAGQASDITAAGAQAVGRGIETGARATAAGAEYAADRTVAGAKAVGRGVEAGARAVGRGAVAGAEYSADRAVAGAKAVGRGTEYVGGRAAAAGRATLEVAAGVKEGTMEVGRAGAEMAWKGIVSGGEFAYNKYQQAREAINVRRLERQNKQDMKAFGKEQITIDQSKAMMAALERQIAASEANQEAIQTRVQARLEAMGIKQEDTEAAAVAA